MENGAGTASHTLGLRHHTRAFCELCGENYTLWQSAYPAEFVLLEDWKRGLKVIANYADSASVMERPSTNGHLESYARNVVCRARLAG